MKIFDQNSANIQKSQAGLNPEVSRAKTASTALPASSNGDDRIDLSAGSHLQALAQTIGSEAQDARVAHIRALVESGNYHVDPAALSQAIVAGTQRGD
jgi:anti-sigma28 factor (negative regulator of flagellin synthesis)